MTMLANRWGLNDSNATMSDGKKKQLHYKFIVKSMSDVKQFKKKIGKNGVVYETYVGNPSYSNDLVVRFRSDLAYDEIIEIMKQIPNSDVMRETLSVQDNVKRSSKNDNDGWHRPDFFENEEVTLHKKFRQYPAGTKMFVVFNSFNADDHKNHADKGKITISPNSDGRSRKIYKVDPRLLTKGWK